MLPRTPLADPWISFPCVLSREARLEALRRGLEPDKFLDVVVESGSESWPRAIDLLSRAGLDPFADQRIFPVNADFFVYTTNVEPVRVRSYDSVRLIGVSAEIWWYPRLVVEWASKPRPLSIWPEDEDDVLDVVEATVRGLEEETGSREVSLDRHRRAWRAWIYPFVEDAKSLLSEWALEAKAFDPRHETAFDIASRKLGQCLAAPIETWIEDDPDHLVRLWLATVAQISIVRKMRQTADREAEARADAVRWVAEFGSPRLRKALDLDLVESAMGVYRDERLRFERPGWMWLGAKDAKSLKSVINPSEFALDVLAEARLGPFENRPELAYSPEGVTVARGLFLGRDAWTPAEERYKTFDLVRWISERETALQPVEKYRAAAQKSLPTYGDEEPF